MKRWEKKFGSESTDDQRHPSTSGNRIRSINGLLNGCVHLLLRLKFVSSEWSRGWERCQEEAEGDASRGSDAKLPSLTWAVAGELRRWTAGPRRQEAGPGDPMCPGNFLVLLQGHCRHAQEESGTSIPDTRPRMIKQQPHHLQAAC